MQVKDLSDPIDQKVIDPNTGKVAFFKGYLTPKGIFLGNQRTGRCKFYFVDVLKEDFQEWEIAAPEDRVDKDLFKIR